MTNIVGLDKDTLQEQLNARNSMKKKMPIFYGILLLGFIGYFLFGRGSALGFVAFFLFLIVFRSVIVWYQWDFLIRFKLKCPHCNQLLATRANVLISPNHDCPHCGQRALAPIKQLVEFEKSQTR